MSFNPDTTKQAQEVAFFLESKMIQVIQVFILIMHEYNNNLFRKILVFFRRENLVFGKYVKIKKAAIGVNLILKQNLLLPFCPC